MNILQKNPLKLIEELKKSSIFGFSTFYVKR
jgi:hypothetical protein